MVQVRWSNGRADRALTWEELEDKIRSDQWWSMTPDEFRLAMQKRALRWSGTEIVTAGSSEQFFAELERAGLVRIENDNPTYEEVL